MGQVKTFIAEKALVMNLTLITKLNVLIYDKAEKALVMNLTITKQP